MAWEGIPQPRIGNNGHRDVESYSIRLTPKSTKAYDEVSEKAYRNALHYCKFLKIKQ